MPRLLAHHAWNTLDGVHAIDTTWPNAPACAYFGIQFPTKIVADWAWRNNRSICPILDWMRPELMREALSALRQ
jgi:hypothetical protein